MNSRESELFIILQEEAAEVIQEICKRQRFGVGERNQTSLELEIGDFLGALRLLMEEGYIDMDNVINSADAKIIKLNTIMTNKIAVPAPATSEKS